MWNGLKIKKFNSLRADNEKCFGSLGKIFVGVVGDRIAMLNI